MSSSNHVTPPDTPPSRPGAQFRRLREDRELTLMDIDALSERMFGPEGKVTYGQVSRIETDKLDRPAMQDLLHLGQIYGLAAQQVAAMYGLAPEEEREPEEIRQLKAMLKTLPADIQRDTLFLVHFAAMVGAARARKRKKSASRIEPGEST